MVKIGELSETKAMVSRLAKESLDKQRPVHIPYDYRKDSLLLLTLFLALTREYDDVNPCTATVVIENTTMQDATDVVNSTRVRLQRLRQHISKTLPWTMRLSIVGRTVHTSGQLDVELKLVKCPQGYKQKEDSTVVLASILEGEII